MFKKITLLSISFFLLANVVFAGITLQSGTTNLAESPSKDNSGFKSVNHYGLGLDLGVPFLGLDLLANYKFGSAKKSGEELTVSETSYGLRKELGFVIKPFFGFGLSNGKVKFKNSGSEEDEQSYTGTWLSAGLNASIALLQIGIEYRYNNASEKTFDYGEGEVNTAKDVNLSSTSNTISLGFGLGF